MQNDLKFDITCSPKIQTVCMKSVNKIAGQSIAYVFVNTECKSQIKSLTKQERQKAVAKELSKELIIS